MVNFHDLNSPPPLPPVPRHEARVCLSRQQAEISRELLLRQAVYPRLIQAGKLTASNAAYRIAALEAVRETLMCLHICELLSRDLHDPPPTDPIP